MRTIFDLVVVLKCGGSKMIANFHSIVPRRFESHPINFLAHSTGVTKEDPDLVVVATATRLSPPTLPPMQQQLL